MSTKLTQKHLFKATHEFEIVDDYINICIKSIFKKDQQETLTVTLAVLNPEPVITRTHLEFVSRVNGEALLSLALSKPNVSEFNDFVNTLKQMAQAEYNSISGINVAATLTGNSQEEPPEFSELSPADLSKAKKIDVASVKHSISMLETYINNDDIQPLITALESLQRAPEDHSKLVEVATVFDNLESSQGAVLTYAPYIILMLSDDPFGSG